MSIDRIKYILVTLIILDYSMAAIFLFAAIAIINMYLHIPNFKRIKQGTETGLRSVLKKRKKD